MNFYPERLAWMRKKRGLTKSSLANLIGVDLRSISAYESGEFEPLDSKLSQLVQILEVAPNFFSKGPLEGPRAEQVSFRSLSKLSAAKRDMALGSAAIAFDFCNWLEERFNLPALDFPDLREDQDPELAASTLRYYWGLGEKPISNMVHLLEAKGVRVFSLALDVRDVDAYCTWNNEQPYIFLNTKKSNARSRFDAAHELGHLMLHKHGDYAGRNAEKEADEFASAFLMPRLGIQPTAPRLPDLKNIIPAKSKWGVSVAAYVYRLHKLNLISDWHYRTLFKQISTRGYRSKEPYDHPREMSKLAKLYLAELSKENIDTETIAMFLGVSERDVQELLFDISIFKIKGGKTIKGNSQDSKHLKLAIDNTAS